MDKPGRAYRELIGVCGLEHPPVDRRQILIRENGNLKSGSSAKVLQPVGEYIGDVRIWGNPVFITVAARYTQRLAGEKLRGRGQVADVCVGVPVLYGKLIRSPV